MTPSNESNDKSNRFREAIERGKRGDVGSYEIWLNDNGYNPDHVDADNIAAHFRKNPTKAVNHGEVLDVIGEYIGYSMTGDRSHHLAVIGPSGIGKTQLLYTIAHLLPALEPEVEGRVIAASTLGEKVEEKFLLSKQVDEIQGMDQLVLCLDDCQLDKRIDVSISDLHNAFNSGVLITTWSPEGYIYFREEVTRSVSPSKELQLGPFSSSDTFETVEAIQNFITEDAVDIQQDTKTRIYELSDGIPGIVVTLMIHALRVAFMNDLEPGSTESIEIAGERLNLPNAMERVYDLSDQKMEVLRWILLSTDSRGRNPGDLVDKLDRDKSTISYHLRTLKDDGLVSVESQGRQSFYSIPDHLASFIQLRLAQDNRIHANL